jgi:hypothetical protein
MYRIVSLRNLLAAAVLSATFAVAGTASASDCHVPPCHYKTVIEYFTVRKPYVGYVTRYDSCDRPYRIAVVRYQSVVVPVKSRVRVCH